MQAGVVISLAFIFRQLKKLGSNTIEKIGKAAIEALTNNDGDAKPATPTNKQSVNNNETKKNQTINGDTLTDNDGSPFGG